MDSFWSPIKIRCFCGMQRSNKEQFRVDRVFCPKKAEGVVPVYSIVFSELCGNAGGWNFVKIYWNARFWVGRDRERTRKNRYRWSLGRKKKLLWNCSNFTSNTSLTGLSHTLEIRNPGYESAKNHIYVLHLKRSLLGNCFIQKVIDQQTRKWLVSLSCKNWVPSLYKGP